MNDDAGATLRVEGCRFIHSNVNVYYDSSSDVTLLNNTSEGTVVQHCRDPTNVYLSKSGNDSNSCLDSLDNSCFEWDYIINNNIIVNNDDLNVDYGIFNISVPMTINHDNYWSTFNYTFKGIGNNSKELSILRDNQAEGSNLFDLSTTGINSNWPWTYITIKELTYYPYHGLNQVWYCISK